MKTTPTLMAAAILLVCASANAYDRDTNRFVSNQSISLDYPDSSYELNTLQLHLENDNPSVVEDRMNANAKVEYASLVNGDLKYDMHEKDM